jgi:DNA-binding XRE family transcriptional regulator
MSTNEKSEFKMAFGSLVRAHRKRLGLSQVDLAKAFGVTRECICAYEGGFSTPSLPNAVRLSALLGFSLDALRENPEAGS